MARISRAEDIYELIRDQILSGRWEAGDRLNDLELSEELQVSRLSVREALFRMTETGVVEKENWKGYFIKKLDDNTVSQIVETRIVLETQALKNFIEVVSEKDILELEKIIQESEKKLETGNLFEYLKIDYTFHEYIYNNQPNFFISSIMNNFQLIIHFVRYKSMGKDEKFITTGKNSIAFHSYILEAIKMKDSKEAVKRLTEHLKEHRKEAVNQIEQD